MSSQLPVPLDAQFVESRRLPADFGQMPGRESVIANLQQRIRNDAHGTSLILYGPAGVGKRTLARLYGKAVYCECPMSEGSPCNACQCCRSFAKQNLFGYISIDARVDQFEDKLKAITAEARRASLADRRITQIDNADACSAEAYDVLLKTMEERPVTFILTACNLDLIRRTIRSRCIAYRVRPLSNIETRNQMRRFIEASRITADEETIDVLAAKSRGIFSEILAITDKVKGYEHLTLQVARKLVGLDWPENMMSVWPQVLASRNTVTDAAALSFIADPLEGLRRIRLLLQQISYYESHGSTTAIADPAFLHMDPSILAWLSTSIRDCAARRGISREALWSQLANTWFGKTLPGLSCKGEPPSLLKS